jgi:photosystem II stability/assembly factor-like uncharacterized protein
MTTQRRGSWFPAIAFALIVAVGLSPAHAGENRWTSNGPSGEIVLSLAIDPTNSANLYAGTQEGRVFRTTSSGLSWSGSSTGLPDANSVRSLAINPVFPSTVYAGTTLGVFKSTNAGGSWSSVLSGATDSLAIDPARPSSIYAGTDRGVSKSTDDGSNWSVKLSTTFNDSIVALAIDPLKHSTIYAADSDYYGSVLYKSTDEGQTWGADGAVSLFVNVDAGALAIDPVQPATLYAGTGYGFYRGTDSGASPIPWKSASVNLSDEVPAVAIDPRDPNTLYAGTAHRGVFKSTDRGETWATFNAGLTNLAVNSLAIDPSGARLHAGTAGGVFDYEISSKPCVPGSNVLCFLGNRFQASLVATDHSTGAVIAGHAVDRGDRFGYFSLPELTGDPTFPEVVIKMVDATSLPAPYGGGFWLFYSTLTDVDYTMTVVDTVSGDSKTYRSDPAIPTCGAVDTAAFRKAPGEVSLDALTAVPGSSLEAASGAALALLGNRFKVTMTAVDPRTGNSAAGQAIPQSNDYGYFSLPGFTGDPAFPEVFIKMVDATAPYGAFWVFYTGLTDLQYTLIVTDTATGAVRTYQNDRSNPAHLCGGIDVAAFLR